MSRKVHVMSSLTVSQRKWYRLEAAIWKVRQRQISKGTLKNSRNPTQIFSSSVPGMKQDLVVAVQCLDKEASIKSQKMSAVKVTLQHC